MLNKHQDPSKEIALHIIGRWASTGKDFERAIHIVYNKPVKQLFYDLVHEFEDNDFHEDEEEVEIDEFGYEKSLEETNPTLYYDQLWRDSDL